MLVAKLGIMEFVLNALLIGFLMLIVFALQSTDYAKLIKVLLALTVMLVMIWFKEIVFIHH
jgi:hypothetical protein